MVVEKNVRIPERFFDNHYKVYFHYYNPLSAGSLELKIIVLGDHETGFLVDSWSGIRSLIFEFVANP